MKKRPKSAPPRDDLVGRAMARLEAMLDDPSAAIRLAAAREILRRSGAGPTGVPVAPGPSSTDFALRLEEELRRGEGRDDE